VDPEPQRDGAPAPNMMLHKRGLSKLSNTMAVSYFSHSVLYVYSIVGKEPEPHQNGRLFNTALHKIYLRVADDTVSFLVTKNTKQQPTCLKIFIDS
jgi:hypothetical protein